jgi:AraC-like DNA-binding protein
LSIDKVVQKAVTYINDNIQNPLTLDEICSAIFVSKSSLCHKFAKSMHVTVNHYVTIKKIHHAAKLIRGGMGVIEASAAVGYNQYTTFYHNYKKILGISPSGSK